MLDPQPGIAQAITVCTVALHDDRLIATRIDYPWSRRPRTGGSECPVHGGVICLETYRLAPTPHAKRGLLARLIRGRR